MRVREGRWEAFDVGAGKRGGALTVLLGARIAVIPGIIVPAVLLCSDVRGKVRRKRVQRRPVHLRLFIRLLSGCRNSSSMLQLSSQRRILDPIRGRGCGGYRSPPIRRGRTPALIRRGLSQIRRGSVHIISLWRRSSSLSPSSRGVDPEDRFGTGEKCK